MLNKLCSGKQLNSRCEHFVLLLTEHRHQTHNNKQSIVIFIWSQALILRRSKHLIAHAILKRTVKVGRQFEFSSPTFFAKLFAKWP